MGEFIGLLTIIGVFIAIDGSICNDNCLINIPYKILNTIGVLFIAYSICRSRELSLCGGVCFVIAYIIRRIHNGK